MSESKTYTPAAYWHRLDDEILEPRQTITVEAVQPVVKKPERRLDWRGVPFPQEAR